MVSITCNKANNKEADSTVNSELKNARTPKTNAKFLSKWGKRFASHNDE